MKIQFKYPVGPNSPFSRSAVFADGREVGEVIARTQGSGWNGRATYYMFFPSNDFAEVGRRAADSQRALKAWINERLTAVAAA